MIGLPQDFTVRMQDMLGEVYPAFMHSYEEERYQSLRINTLKISIDDFMKKAPFPLMNSVAWEKRGFYYDKDMPFGRHPFHEAGAYYIQEPSAMSPAVYLEAKPFERVLDLCAAPGGKSTQIASYMENKGLLVSNEIHPVRAKILSENIERMGIRNALVTNETPQRLAEIFVEYFDRIMVDAPCSGEGMFRKNEDACGEWSLENVQLCADRQDEILDCADLMLRPGGRLVYSTCTFAPEENEGSIRRFMERHNEYELLEMPLHDGMTRGVPEWVQSNDKNLGRTIRLFPHMVKGEGHYIAVLWKKGEVPDKYQGFPTNGLQKGGIIKEVKEFEQFAQETLSNTGLMESADNRLLKFGGQLYLMPENMPSLDRLKVLRAGLHLGTFKKNRFEPSHALALALDKKDVKRYLELETDEKAAAYLSGMTLNHDGEKGWYLITYKGCSIGWGKLAGQVMKNHYPKGLRK